MDRNPDERADDLADSQPRPGDPFPCPWCGDNDDDTWVAHYMVPESQGITLSVGADGTPEEGDYDGQTKGYDADANDFYQCLNCGNFMNLDGTKRESNET